MSLFEQFRDELRDALAHLHDPDFEPTAVLCAVLGCDPAQGVAPVQAEIIQAVGDLKPADETPTNSRARRDYDILDYRFLQKLTQEETAERLYMSVRSMRRAQRAATHTLARLLWESGLARGPSGAETPGYGADDPGSNGADRQRASWHAQVKEELASLQKGTPSAVADVAETIKRAVELEQVLVSAHGIGFDVGQVPSGLLAAIHPAVLREILVMSLGSLARYAPGGDIHIETAVHEEQVHISLRCRGARHRERPDIALISEILNAQGGTVQIMLGNDEHVECRMTVPAAGHVTVVVVDDNVDLVHFYRRCTVGTRYRIVQAEHGQRSVEIIQAKHPDVIVLDIMLPDVDGWELLNGLQKHPATRHVPVIICSIVMQRELAMALGASFYLPKPVERRDFIEALDQALKPVSATLWTTPSNSGRDC